MEKIRGLRDTITKKSDKKCCVKVAVGVAVVVVLLIVIIVAAVLSTSGEDSPQATSSNDKKTSGTSDGTPTAPVKLKGLDLENHYLLRMGSPENPSFNEILAIDDEHQAYIMQIDQTYKTVYVVVNFQQASQVFVGIRKEHENGNVKENTVLFCHESKFSADFSGSYLSSSQLTTGSHTAVINGRTTDLTVDSVGAVYKASPLVASVINGSCSLMPKENMIQWQAKKSECTVPTEIDKSNTTQCFLNCPKCKDLAQTEKQSCTKFDQCNYDMSYCDLFWKSSAVYNGQPYCICRQTLSSDMQRISCPKSGADGGDCEVPRRTIVDFENNNSCFCRYSIPIIHPYKQTGGDAKPMFTLQSVIVTAPAAKFEECELRNS